MKIKCKVSSIVGLCLFVSLCQSQNIAKVINFNGVPAISINDSIIPPFAYASYISEGKNYKEISQAGIHLYFFPAYLGDQGINSGSGIGLFRKSIWKDFNQYDYSSIKEDFEKIIKEDPNAKIIIRLYLDPPRWWTQKNPDGATQLPNGEIFRQCFASEKWKQETSKALKDCIGWLKRSIYAKYTVGIHIAAGGTEEWYYHPVQQRDDMNPLRTIAFRSWLSKKYHGDLSVLQDAWHDKNVTFANAVPTLMDEKPKQQWLIPSKEQKRMNSYQFHAEILADDISYFCKVVKDNTNREWLTGVFYGYNNSITDPRYGHGAFKKVLECKDVDFIASPNEYNRVIGEDWAPQLSAQTVLLHGKMLLAENDTRTCLTTLLKEKAPEIVPKGQYESGVWVGPEDMQTSLSFLWKNAGRMLAYGYGGWWFDMWGGWFSNPKMLDVFKLTNEFYKYPLIKASLMTTEVCVVEDEQLCFMDASYGDLTRNIIFNIYPLGKTGTTFDNYLRSDLSSLSFNQYKVIWLMGFVELSKDELNMIDRLVKENKTIILTEPKGTHIYNVNGETFVKDFVTFTDSQLRSIFKDAGVHIYDYSGDVFYIGRNWLCSHTIFGGEKTIYLPFDAKVIDPINGNIKYNSTRVIKFVASPKSTTIFRIIPL